MAAPARQLEERLAEIERMLRELLARERSSRAGAGQERAFYTKREAARILRCDRYTTLEELIRTKRLLAVPGPSGGLRIPRAEVERVKTEGFRPATGPAPVAPRSRKGSRARARAESAAEVAEAIRAIPVPQLDE